MRPTPSVLGYHHSEVSRRVVTRVTCFVIAFGLQESPEYSYSDLLSSHTIHQSQLGVSLLWSMIHDV